jgi:membrane protein implicated in regulation of membrane protease activity
MMAYPWWAWMVLAGGLALAEMGVPGAYLMWIALGAALTGALDAAFGLSLEGQILSFSVTSALSCVAGFFVYRRMRRGVRGEIPMNEPGLAMLGARGTVCEALLNGRGKVRLGDGVWLADGPDLAEGTPVVVSAVRGTRLVVQRVERKSGSESPEAARAS